tara:strand:+ start:1255 stop:3555 length:2301 start_codon:yes stop_codon:yes gene_type:complete
MNIIDIQDQLKNFSEDQLINEMQMPSGNTPQFLVLSEIQRRKRMRDDFAKRQAAQQPTVAEEAIAAAGVPQSGIAGMSEAMAPKSTMVQNAVGSAMPEAMRSGGLMQFGNDILKNTKSQEVDPFLDEVEDMAESRFGVEFDNNMMGADRDYRFNKRPAIGRPFPIFSDMRADLPFESQSRRMPIKGGPRMALTPPPGQLAGLGSIYAGGQNRAIAFEKGGLVDALFSKTDHGKKLSSNQFEVRKGKDGRRMVYKKGTNIFVGTADKVFDEKYDGGVLHANAGMYFDAQGRPTKELIEAMIMQESAGNPLARGSLDEVGIGQLRPSTALMPGYGVSSMFPDIASQIGEGKMFSTADEAYAANKELIDSTLEDPDRSRAFMGDYLAALRANADSDERAIAAYNMGLGGAKELEDPAQFGYVTDVASKMSGGESPSMMDSVLEKVKTVASAAGNAVIPSATASTIYPEPEPEDTGGSLLDFLNRNALGPAGRELFGTETEEDLEAKRILLGGQRSGEEAGERKEYEQSNQYFYSQEYQNYLRRLGLNPEKLDPNSVPDRLGTFDVKSPIEHMNMNEAAQKRSEKAALALAARQGKNQDDVKTKTDSEATDSDAENKQKEQEFNYTKDTESVNTLEQEIIDLMKSQKADRESDKWLAIAQAGLAIMSSDNPTLLGAIGEGGAAGLKAYREAQDRYNEGVIDLINARAKLAKASDKDLTASNVISRLNTVSKMIASGVDQNGMPLDPEKLKQYQMEELTLRRMVGLDKIAV